LVITTKPRGWTVSLNFLYPWFYVASVLLSAEYGRSSVAALAFISYGTVLELNYFGVVSFPYCTNSSGLKAAGPIIFRQSVCLPDGCVILPGWLTAKTKASGRTTEETSGALESLQALHENIIHSISSGLTLPVWTGASRW